MSRKLRLKLTAACAVLLAVPIAGLVPAGAHAAPARVQKVRWQPNGAVDALASTRTRTFLGGAFTRMVNPATNQEVRRVRLAAVGRSDGGLDRTFHARVNGRVTALAVFDHKLYLGGNFTRVNGVNRQHLAALRLPDGRLVRGRHIQVDGPVLALLHMGQRLYVGGNFTHAAGVSRSKLFAVRPHDTLVPDWPVQTASTDGGAYVLAASPHRDKVIVGGAFHHLVGTERTFLGSISTGGQVTPWTPQAACSTNCFVKDLAVGTRRVYAAIAGPGGHAIAYRLSGGGISWSLRSNGDVSAIAQSGPHILLGGHFDKVGGKAHRMFAQVSATGAVMSRRLATSGKRYPGILAIDVRSGVAMLGGGFDEIDGQAHLAAIAA